MERPGIVAESLKGRRLVGRLERGGELLDGIGELCRAYGVRSGELRALGAVDDVELRDLDFTGRGLRPARRFASPFTILHCLGHIGDEGGRPRIEATCTLSRERDNGIELLGGHLVRARVIAVEFVIESFDDLVLRCSIDPASGLSLWTVEPGAIAGPPVVTPAAPVITFDAPARGHIAGTPAAAPAALSTGPLAGSGAASTSSASAPSWADVARSSAERTSPVEEEEAEPDEDATEDPLRAGDVIDHPRFGRCEVERIEGDSEYAQVRLRNRRLVRLSLDVLQLVRDGLDEHGQRRYRARVLR